MIVLWMALFFALACAITWLMLFPGAGARPSNALNRAKRFTGAVIQLIGTRGARPSRHQQAALQVLVPRRRLLFWILAILLLPALLVLVLRHEVILDGYERIERPLASATVQELLRGERLVPPPPPPPEVFLTEEVEALRPMTATADRKWDQLDTDFTQRLLAVYRVMQEQHSYEMVLVEGYRSAERQDRLAARGQHVTRASGGRSWHQYGLAADSVFLREGKLVISERDPWAMRGYQLYGQAAKEAGLVWGGDWRSIKDLMHVELRRPGVMSP